jgi:hypothetical protein
VKIQTQWVVTPGKQTNIYTYIITFGLIIEIMAILFSSICFNKFISTLVQIICDFKMPQRPDISPFKHIRKISKNDLQLE